MDDTPPVDQSPNGWFTARVDGIASNVRRSRLPSAFPAHKGCMFRLRTIVLLWLGRRLWTLVRPAVERRLRKHGLFASGR
jgi:hypothetical protein